MSRLVLPAALALVLSACATLSGRSQFVAVDSAVRGVEVRDPERPEKPLGVTPFFLELPRASGYVWSAHAPNAPTLPHVFECRYRWGESLLGALAPGMIATAATPLAGAAVLGALSVGDLVTGAAWQCPLRIEVPTPKPPEGTSAPPPKTERCATYVMVPPRHSDLAVSRHVAKRVQSLVAQGGACVRWANEATAEALWQRFGVDYDTDFDLERFERERLNELGHGTGATHLVVAAVEPHSDTVFVQPRVHDLFTLESRSLPELTLETKSVAGRSDNLPSVAWWGSLVPNAASFAIAFKNDRFEGANGFDVRRDSETGSSLPSTLSNWSLGYIEPPGSHGRYDLTLRLSPEFLFGYNERRLTLAPREPGATRVEDVSVMRLIVAYGPTLALFTPLGEFSGTLSLGAGFAADWTKTRDVAFDAGRYANVSINFTTFVSENVFVRAGVQMSVAASPIVQRSDYSLSLLEQTNITLGYMLPGLRTLVRSGF